MEIGIMDIIVLVERSWMNVVVFIFKFIVYLVVFFLM